MIALPTVPAVTVNDVLDDPLVIVALEGTDATALFDEERETTVFEDTPALMLAVRVCVLPGASESVEGVKDEKVGVVVPPPVPDALDEAIYK